MLKLTGQVIEWLIDWLIALSENDKHNYVLNFGEISNKGIAFNITWKPSNKQTYHGGFSSIRYDSPRALFFFLFSWGDVSPESFSLKQNSFVRNECNMYTNSIVFQTNTRQRLDIFYIAWHFGRAVQWDKSALATHFRHCVQFSVLFKFPIF